MNVLIIGFGSIGRRHFEVLSSFNLISCIEVVTKQMIPELNTHVSINDVDNLDKFDYFVISNETYKHFETLKFIDENTFGKKIFCEKPLFDSYYDVRFLKNSIYVGYVLRYHPILHLLKEAIKGQVVLSANIFCGSYLPSWRPDTDYRVCYSALRNKGGGVLLDLSHEIDYIIWLFGDLVEMKSYCAKVSNLAIDSEDTALVLAKTNVGTLITLSLDYITKTPRRFIMVNTNELTISIDLIKSEIRVIDEVGSVVLFEKNSNLERNHLFKNMHDSILSDTGTCCTFEEGLNVMKIIDQLKAENLL